VKNPLHLTLSLGWISYRLCNVVLQRGFVPCTDDNCCWSLSIFYYASAP